MEPRAFRSCAASRGLLLPALLRLLQLLITLRGGEADRNLLYRAAPACYNFSSELFRERTECVPDLFIPGTWRGHSRDVLARSRRGSTLYGTAMAQRAIYEQQHPPNCKDAKFLIHTFQRDNHGFGSVIHVMAYGLQQALSLGRVYIGADQGGNLWARKSKFCEPSVRFDECYLVPLSSCSYDEVLEIHRDSTLTLDSSNGQPLLPRDQWAHYSLVIVHNQWVDEQAQQHVPPILLPALRGGPIPLGVDDAEEEARAAAAGQAQGCSGVAAGVDARRAAGFKVQWLRAQTTAYIMRPNPRFLAEVHSRIRSIFPSPRHLPHGTIGVHVRRGDKGRETQDTEDGAYLARAEQMQQQSAAAAAQAQAGAPAAGSAGVGHRAGDWAAAATAAEAGTTRLLAATSLEAPAGALQGRRLQQEQLAEPMPALGRTIFLSTEDTRVVEVFKAATNWTVLYTDVQRYHSTTTSPMDFATEHDVRQVAASDFSSLLLTLQCSGWVGSLSSNWVRLIHELRSTVRCKAHLPFYDSRYGPDFVLTELPSLWRRR